MSIDYDRLRDLVRIADGGRRVRDYATEHDAERDLENLAPDLARELLRLHDGVGELVENKLAAAGVVREQIDAWFLPNDLGYAVAAAEVMCDELTALLEGDTE